VERSHESDVVACLEDHRLCPAKPCQIKTLPEAGIVAPALPAQAAHSKKPGFLRLSGSAGMIKSQIGC
jgi:hypothetical protein